MAPASLRSCSWTSPPGARSCSPPADATPERRAGRPTGSQVDLQRPACRMLRSSQRLFIVDADGSEHPSIPGATGNHFDIDATWSPDGTLIAFTALRADRRAATGRPPDQGSTRSPTARSREVGPAAARRSGDSTDARGRRRHRAARASTSSGRPMASRSSRSPSEASGPPGHSSTRPTGTWQRPRCRGESRRACQIVWQRTRPAHSQTTKRPAGVSRRAVGRSGGTEARPP